MNGLTAFRVSACLRITIGLDRARCGGRVSFRSSDVVRGADGLYRALCSRFPPKVGQDRCIGECSKGVVGVRR